jgi:23S rRNA (uridine2552-2'-O)-methyltransferase
LAFNHKDFYFKKAKKENFVARSVYKLEEIDHRHRIFKSSQSVVDLGASPGSWSQYVSKKIGNQGKILGIDLTPITLNLPNAVFVTGDIEETDMEKLLQEHNMGPKVDVVISDMAPKTTGIKSADQARSMALCEMALYVAQKILKPGGSFVVKFFHSGDFESYRKMLRASFTSVDALKPKGTRQESKEIFFICHGFKA